MVKYLSSYIFEIRNRDIIPCATENIAVVDDNDSRILKFKIPAVIDDVDITDKILAIRYVNALGQFDTFFSDTREIKIDGDKRYIIFPWYLSQKATAASGTLTYDISIYDGHITDAAEEGQYILHTKPQVLNIEKGLLDVGSASQNPDVWTDAIATFQKIISSYNDNAMNAADAAKKSEAKANTYKDAAAVSASNAAASEAKAKQSEQNAATSETNAVESANKAKASQTASATSEANAKISEQNAKVSENASKASADDSASSASDSANSAQASLNSQNAAKTSETKALASEKAAKQSETNAATSVQNASNYADNSQQSANDAAASAAAALVSQNAAKASEDKAKISETNAKASETNVANALVGTLKLSGGTMTGDITMSGDAKFVGNLTGNAYTATSAESATNDSIGQQIDATYIKDLRPTGNKIIITKGNNETSTVVTDTNYATRTNAGIVQIGDNITVDNKGLISLIKDNVVAALGFTPANNNHTHNYAGSGSAGGSANSAVKLDTATAGSATKPVYISGGKPVACTYSLGKDVPANAVFTDHTYDNMTASTASAAGKAGLVPAPPAGAQGKFLRGDGTWQAIASSGLSAYPVGSIYQSTDPTSPAALFGGSWAKVSSERVLMGASSTHAAGTTVEAGLPNITGTLSDTMGTFWASPSGSGAFSGKYIGRSLENGSVGNYGNIFFDASKSNAIYGRSSTVQPAAYYVHIWKRVS